MNKMQNVIVRTSTIQGKGVFAGRNFKPGEEILEIDDSHVVEDKTTMTEEDWEYNADFFDGRIVIMQEPEKCINHSCDPNSYVKTMNRIRKVFAMKNIAKGEEVTCDYTINGENEGTFPCNCGAKRCRKIYIGNYFKLPVQLQIEYLPFLEDWFMQQHKDEIGALKKRRQRA